MLIATEAYNKYKSVTGATADTSTGLLKISSANFANLKSLYYTIGGVSRSVANSSLNNNLIAYSILKTTFEFTANAQIWPRSLNVDIGGTAGSIYLVVADIGSGAGSGLDFINGQAWLERFYSVYDTTKKQVGIANTPFTRSTSN